MHVGAVAAKMWLRRAANLMHGDVGRVPRGAGGHRRAQNTDANTKRSKEDKKAILSRWIAPKQGKLMKPEVAC